MPTISYPPYDALSTPRTLYTSEPWADGNGGKWLWEVVPGRWVPYAEHDHDDRYYTEAEVNALLPTRVSLGLGPTHAVSFGTVTATFTGNLTGVASGNLVPGGALGTPASGNLSNCTFPTLNQSTTGNAGTVSGFARVAGKTLTANNTLTLSGTDGSTLNIGTGGSLGSAAYTSSAAYATAAHSHAGADITSGNIAVARIAAALTAPGAIGGTTPGAGTFTTVTATTFSGALAGNAATVTGFSVIPGKSLGVFGTVAIGGIDNSTLYIGNGGALDSAAFTPSSNYATAAQGINERVPTAAGIAGKTFAAGNVIPQDSDLIPIAYDATTLLKMSLLVLWGFIKSKIDLGQTWGGAQAFASATRPTSLGTNTLTPNCLLKCSDGDARYLETVVLYDTTQTQSASTAFVQSATQITLRAGTWQYDGIIGCLSALATAGGEIATTLPTGLGTSTMSNQTWKGTNYASCYTISYNGVVIGTNTEVFAFASASATQAVLGYCKGTIVLPSPQTFGFRVRQRALDAANPTTLMLGSQIVFRRIA